MPLHKTLRPLVDVCSADCSIVQSVAECCSVLQTVEVFCVEEVVTLDSSNLGVGQKLNVCVCVCVCV